MSVAVNMLCGAVIFAAGLWVGRVRAGQTKYPPAEAGGAEGKPKGRRVSRRPSGGVYDSLEAEDRADRETLSDRIKRYEEEQVV